MPSKQQAPMAMGSGQWDGGPEAGRSQQRPPGLGHTHSTQWATHSQGPCGEEGVSYITQKRKWKKKKEKRSNKRLWGWVGPTSLTCCSLFRVRATLGLDGWSLSFPLCKVGAAHLL